MTRKINPTFKQKKAFDKIVENHGNVSKTMLEVGYDENTARNPKNLTESKGWKKLVEEKVKDQRLIDVLNEGLNAGKTLRNNEGEEIYFEADYNVRHKYLETALKIKEKIPENPSINQLHFHKHEKIIKIVKEAEDKAEQILREEIEETNESNL